MKKAVTLLELLISIVLLSIIVFGFANIDFFSRAQVDISGRQAKLQNEVSLALSHMAKNVSRAIGNERINGNNSVINIGNIGGNQAVRAFIDFNNNGTRDNFPPDRWIAYRFTGSPEYQIWFCPQCINSTCNNCNPAWVSNVNNIVSRMIAGFLIKPAWGGGGGKGGGGNVNNIVSRMIAGFLITKPGAPGALSENFITVEITACWDPATAESVDNPCVTMSSSIKMPSVSVN